MAKKTKSSGAIKTLTNRDKELLAQLSRTGVITREQAIKYLKYDNNYKRLSNLVKAGYLREQVARRGKEEVICYKIDKVGKDYVRDYIPSVNAIYNGAGFSHDHKMTELYYTQFYDYRDSWRTEQDYKMPGQEGCPDAVITIGTVEVAVEVITRSYSNEQITSKEIYAEQNGLELRKFYA